MEYIDLHAHMVSRTTDDYRAMAMSGCCRRHRAGVLGRLRPPRRRRVRRLLQPPHRLRAQARRHLRDRHYLDVPEPEGGRGPRADAPGARGDPAVLERPTVLGIGEIGLNRVTGTSSPASRTTSTSRWSTTSSSTSTPHLEDKWKGTKVIVETLVPPTAGSSPPRDGRPRGGAHDRHDPRQRVLDRADAVPDHEGLARARGRRARDARPDRICVASACDWGPSALWPCPTSSWRCAAAATVTR